MSADFILYALPECKTLKKRGGELIRMTNKMGLKDFTDPGWDTDEDARSAIRDAIGFYFNAVGRGDVVTIRPEGALYGLIISGGMSYGDSPTDACDYMSVICDCDKIYNKIREWALEDAADADKKMKRRKK